MKALSIVHTFNKSYI